MKEKKTLNLNDEVFHPKLGWITVEQAIVKVCPICGVTFKSFSCAKRIYCSTECFHKSRIGKKNLKQSLRMQGEKNPMFGRKFSEEHRRNISLGVKKAVEEGRLVHPWKGKEAPDWFKKKVSEVIRKQYENGRESWNKGKTKETEPRLRKLGESVSKSIKERIVLGTYKSSTLGKKWHISSERTPETRKKLSQAIKEKWEDPEYRKRVIPRIVAGIQKSKTWRKATRENMRRLAGNKGFMTPIEKKLLLILDKMELEINKDFFVKQYVKTSKHYRTPDFVVKTFKTIIECDGGMHKWIKTGEFETERDRELLEVFPNYQILHITGRVLERVNEDIIINWLRGKFLHRKKSVTYLRCRS